MEFTAELLKKAFDEAEQKASEAAENWLRNATPKYEVYQADIFGARVNPNAPKEYMLDLCGNSYLEVKDLRTKCAKALVKNGYVKPWGSGKYVDFTYRLKSRQEYGLHEVATKTFRDVLLAHGITGIVMKSYID